MYIFKRDNKYIGMDDNSGGYPYETNYCMAVKVWYSKEKALKYQKTCKEHDWKLYKLNGLLLTEEPN